MWHVLDLIFGPVMTAAALAVVCRSSHVARCLVEVGGISSSILVTTCCAFGTAADFAIESPAPMEFVVSCTAVYAIWENT